MLAGIAFQMVGITLYVGLASEFLWRYITRRPVRAGGAVASDHSAIELADKASQSQEGSMLDRSKATKRIKLMLSGLVFSTLVIFIRSVYRTIELADGWSGRIITTQVYFSQSLHRAHQRSVLNIFPDVLDGAMIVLAMYTLNIFHPGVLLRED
jgi:hypothetical protein